MSLENLWVRVRVQFCRVLGKVLLEFQGSLKFFEDILTEVREPWTGSWSSPRIHQVQDVQGSRADVLCLLVRVGGEGGEAQRVVEGPGKKALLRFKVFQDCVCACVSVTDLRLFWYECKSHAKCRKSPKLC